MRRAFGLMALILAMLVSACGGLAGEPVIVATIPAPTAAPAQTIALEMPENVDLALGEQIFAEKCIDCHGITGAGDGAFVATGQIRDVPDFTDPATIAGQTPADYYRVVTEGRLEKLMPPFPSLSDDERWSVALYVYNLSSSDTPASNDADVASETNTTSDAVAAAPVATEEADIAADAPDDTADDTQTAETNDAPATTDENGLITTTGTISGQVVNGTADAGVSDDMTVTLHIVDAQFNEETRDTQIDDEGRYVFADVPVDLHRAYFVTVNYAGGRFVSDFVGGDPEVPDQTLDIMLYEATDDASVLQVSALRVQVTYVQDMIHVIELVELVNTSDRMYTRQLPGTDSIASVEMRLPEGARLTTATDSRRYMLADDGTTVYDLQSVLPDARHTVHLVYTLPAASNTSVIEPLLYPLDGPAEVYVSEGLALHETTLTDHGTSDASEYTYAIYAGRVSIPANSDPGYRVDLVSGATTTTATATESSDLPVLPLVLAIGGVVALIGAVVLYLRTNNQAAPSPVPQPVQSVTMQELVRQIAELDEQYEVGQLDADVYEQRRKRLKAQLALLMKNGD